jgi:sugar phosphate isomerase/epimerase
VKIGVMDGVLGGDDAAAFERAARLGAKGVEVNLRLAELRQAGHRRRDELRRLAAFTGVPIPSACLGEHNNGGLATWWRGSEAEEEVRQAVRWCARIGAQTLLLPFFFMNEPKGQAHRRAVAERLKPLCEDADSQGVVIAFEGVLPASQLHEMAAHIGRGFGVYFDVANAAWCDMDPAAEIRALGSLLQQCHAKEAKVFTGDARLGEGRVDHAACAAALREVGYDRWIVLETPAGTDAQVGADQEFARKVYASG